MQPVPEAACSTCFNNMQQLALLQAGWDACNHSLIHHTLHVDAAATMLAFSDVCRSLTEGEKAFIQADPDNALKDEALLQQIAGRHNCGVSGVREHIREYKQWRDEMTAIAEIAKEHKEGVRALPRTKVAMHARVEEKLKQKKHGESVGGGRC